MTRLRPMRAGWAGGLVAAAIALTSVSRAAGGDPERGRLVFEKCVACHAVDDQPKDGPSLKGVIGRKAASRDDYRYSAALKRSDITWTTESLDAYLADPQAYVKGNRMAFAGLPEKQDRDDVIAYLEAATK